jgi:murein DD-endopeptidase MepM/ murein hydrolase activator NlpD
VNRALPALLTSLAAFLLSVSCTAGVAPTPSPFPSPSPVASPTPAPSPSPEPSATSTPQPVVDTSEPTGFPIDPSTKLGLVVGHGADRHVDWSAGPDALTHSRDNQVSGDSDLANNSGWDCRTHVEYEGQPAVDWYVPIGTPVYATMDGVATLNIVTVGNAFDYNGVPRGPYMGNPEREEAPVAPFGAMSGGKGVFVEIQNDGFLIDYGHLDPALTIASVQPLAFVEGYGPGYDFMTAFATIRDFRVYTTVAQWTVKRGDLIGYAGDVGYSDAPHLHYSIKRVGESSLLCPTNEAGFEGGGWLFK